MALLPVDYDHEWRREQQCVICDVRFVPETLIKVSENAYAPICPVCQAQHAQDVHDAQTQRHQARHASDWVRARIQQDRERREVDAEVETRWLALRATWAQKQEWER